MRIKLTPAFVAKPPPPKKGDRVFYWDTTQSGFGLMVTTAGHRSYVCQYRAERRSRRMHLRPGLNLTDARREAKAILGRVAKGGDPLGDKRKAAQASENSFSAVAESFLQREGGKLRSADQRRKTFERLVYRKIGAAQIDAIRRSDIVKLLDGIEDERGPRMAHVVLAYISRVFNWHAGRHDEFRSPLVRGMGRINPKENVRSRVLSDDELRAVWTAAEASGKLFDHYVQFVLLTAVRRNEAARMTRAELDGTDWLIPASRMKGKQDHLVPLSQKALDILAELPAIGKSDGFIFTNDGHRALRGFGMFKADLQARSGTSGWTLHDLRRTARTLMTRAGVPSDHAERCLAHVIGGIRGVYDHHEFYSEKKAAFEALAGLIERIVPPPGENVVNLSERPQPTQRSNTSLGDRRIRPDI
jgi:integrase